MKKFLFKTILIQIIMILCLTFSVWGEVTLRWDANEPTPEGYRIFQTTATEPFDYDNPVFETTETEFNVIVPKDVLHIFCVRAFNGDVISGDSNWVYYMDETQAPPVFYQTRPKNVRMIFEE